MEREKRGKEGENTNDDSRAGDRSADARRRGSDGKEEKKGNAADSDADSVAAALGAAEQTRNALISARESLQQAKRDRMRRENL